MNYTCAQSGQCVTSSSGGGTGGGGTAGGGGGGGGGGTGGGSACDDPTGLQYEPLEPPCRAVDTRTTARLSSGGTYVYRLAGTGSPCAIPPSARAVSAVVTALLPDQPGELRLAVRCAPDSGVGPPIPVVAFESDAGRTAWNNNWLLPLSSTGDLGVLPILANTAGTTHLIIDITGYFAPPSAQGADYFPLASPARLIDTRGGAGLVGGVVSNFTAKGTDAGVPQSGPIAISGNAVVVQPVDAGFLRLFNSTFVMPATSVLNYVAGDVVGNGGIVNISAAPGPDLGARAVTDTDLIYDVTGYFGADAGSRLRLVEPCRFATLALVANQVSVIAARGVCGIPSVGVRALAVNATVSQPSTTGSLRLYPAGIAMPVISTINFRPNQPLANGAIVTLSSTQDLAAFSQANLNLSLDVIGYFSP